MNTAYVFSHITNPGWKLMSMTEVVLLGKRKGLIGGERGAKEETLRVEKMAKVHAVYK